MDASCVNDLEAQGRAAGRHARLFHVPTELVVHYANESVDERVRGGAGRSLGWLPRDGTVHEEKEIHAPQTMKLLTSVDGTWGWRGAGAAERGVDAGSTRRGGGGSEWEPSADEGGERVVWGGGGEASTTSFVNVRP
jgi:hypothetical protein